MNPEINAACGKLLQRYLMSSWCYYHLHKSVMPDAEFDQMATVLLAYYDHFEHQHKHLVTKGDLDAGTLLLGRGDYPMMVTHAAELWLNDLKPQA